MIVVFTVAYRPEYLRQVLDSWSKVRGVGTATLVFCVEPGSESESVCRDVDFAGAVEVHVNVERYGVLGNPWHALNYGFTKSDFVVLAEEDTPVSADVLEYFAWARHEFADDDSVKAVCSHLLDAARGGAYDVFRTSSFSPIVWATWRSRWESFFRDTWDFDYAQRGWDWNINRMLTEQRACVIRPAQSRSQHIGQQGGAHCTVDFFPQTVSLSYEADRARGEYRKVESI